MQNCLKTAYKEWQKDHPDMPSHPDKYIPYQKHWKGWTHFLGNEKLPWEEGLKKVSRRKIVRPNCLQGMAKDHPDMPK